MSKTLFDNGIGRRVFGEDVEGYEAGRPGYPEELFRILEERASLRPGASIFEVGPGTGQATRELLRVRPSRLAAIEPDERLAQRLARLWAEPGTDFQIQAAAFEDALLEETSF